MHICICVFEYGLSLTAFRIKKMVKIPQSLEDVILFKQTVTTFFFVDSCFGLILLFYNI